MKNAKIMEENRMRLNREMTNAAQYGRTEQVRNCLKLGADVNFVSPSNFGYTALHNAAREGHCETVKVLLKYGANTEARDNIEHRTALHCAAARKKPECMRLLLDKGGSFIDARDKHNCTPLHHAINVGSTEIVKLLISRGADKNIKNDQEKTPLMLATSKERDDYVDLLLSGTIIKDGRRKIEHMSGICLK